MQTSLNHNSTSGIEHEIYRCYNEECENHLIPTNRETCRCTDEGDKIQEAADQADERAHAKEKERIEEVGAFVRANGVERNSSVVANP